MGSLHANLMYRILSHIHHLNVSHSANFVEYRSRQTKIHIAIKHPDDIVFFGWMQLLEPRAVL